MKKMFLALMTSLALASYGYAQDDEEEYEEDDAPAKVEKKAADEEEEEEEEEDEAPAKPEKKKESKPRVATNAGDGKFGFQLDLIDALDNNASQKFYITYKLAPDMELSLILGLFLGGETSAEANGVEVKAGDDYTQLQIGVGFDYFVTEKLLPISVGGEFLYSSWGEDNSQIDFNILGGFRANLAKNLYLNGKVGLAFNYKSWSESDIDFSRLDIGLKTGIMVGWFFM
ncbi:MAG: hypothetical protein MJZ26_11030 [Fibrobacter sp.]|nr:hypothetical protein [Fibrobacter sp.]